MYHPEPNKNPDWITRIYSEDGHIRHEHVIKNMTQSEAATKAQEWSNSLGYSEFILEQK